MNGVKAFVAAVGLALCAGSSPAHAQNMTGRCIFEFRNTPNTRLQAIRLPSGQSNIFLGAGVDAFCKAQNITLLADSAEYYGDLHVWYLIGNVRYSEPRARVNSRRATYWTVEDRLLAEGDVVAAMPNGSTMRGPTLEYFRVIPNVRPRERVVAPGRPRIQLIQKDTTPGRTTARADTAHLVANTVVMDGDSLVFASGKVEITRPDMIATGDSAFMDSGHESARLMRTPAIEGRGERAFRLTGVVIDVKSRLRKLERVLSSGEAHAVSEDLDLKSDTIDMRIRDNGLERAFAWGKSRARAVSPQQDMIADSIDVRMPNQRVSEVHAVRQALAQSSPDTMKISRSQEKDWIRGDTIIARFDSAAVGDTSKKPRLRSLTAIGSASSFYQIPSSEGRAGTPGVNYVRGRGITVRFDQQQVSTVSVDGQATGLFLEANAGSARGDATEDQGTIVPADRPAVPMPIRVPPATVPTTPGAEQQQQPQQRPPQRQQQPRKKQPGVGDGE